jgi:hypothetical protein
VKTIRLSWSLATALLWAGAASAGLGGCGGSTEVVQSPAPAKVKWGDSDAPASEEPAASDEPKAEAPAAAPPADEQASPTEIDLDAPAPKAAAAPPAPAAEEADVDEGEAAPEAPSAADNPLAVELQKRRIAKERKANKGKKPPKSKKKAAAAAPEAGAAAYTGSDPCRATSFSVPRVREACASGGRAAAKRVMKDAIGKATATGQSLKCSNCHTNQRDYALKSDAVAELKRWLDG